MTQDVIIFLTSPQSKSKTRGGILMMTKLDFFIPTFDSIPSFGKSKANNSNLRIKKKTFLCARTTHCVCDKLIALMGLTFSCVDGNKLNCVPQYKSKHILLHILGNSRFRIKIIVLALCN